MRERSFLKKKNTLVLVLLKLPEIGRLDFVAHPMGVSGSGLASPRYVARYSWAIEEVGLHVGFRPAETGLDRVVVLDLGFTTLLTSQVISVAFYSEREKSDKFCSAGLISA